MLKFSDEFELEVNGEQYNVEVVVGQFEDEGRLITNVINVIAHDSLGEQIDESHEAFGEIVDECDNRAYEFENHSADFDHDDAALNYYDTDYSINKLFA